MESRQVRHFLAVYDAGTFAAAGTKLGITQQALSKSIARLEQQLGVLLFERDGLRVRPTAFADLYLPHARAIAAEGERFRAQLRDAMGTGRGTIRIGVGPTAASGIAARALTELTRSRPGVRVTVLAGLYDRMRDDLAAGRLDLFVANRPSTKSDPIVAEEVIAAARYVAVAGATHPLAGRPSCSLAELQQTAWIAGQNLGEVDEAITRSFVQAGLKRPLATVETTSILFTLGLLRAGQHVTVLPMEIVAPEIAAGRLRDLELDGGDWSLPVVMAYRTSSIRLPVMAQLIDAIRGAAQQSAAAQTPASLDR
jgi:DNA-binding transcriptional LysR family regulator